MLNSAFYDQIDSEVDDLAIVFSENTHLIKQDANGKKSFCFLIWFLKNYVPEIDPLSIEKCITEGGDDSSADIIFKNKNQFGEEIYYIVQAKWFAKKNIGKSKGITKEIKACITDFNLILSGKKSTSTKNESFNREYKKFLEHKKGNGKVKFIFLALCSVDVDISEYIDNFSDNKLVFFELFDIFNIKRQYIEINYKGIKTNNPIEEPYLPVSKIDLSIEKSQTISVLKPFNSNIFLIKPEVIFNLFSKFGNSIFYKNIRNPLPKSLYNKEIQNTILTDPKLFWYFNNGITAITEKIRPFYPDALNVSIEGLQIINGAQTVYNVFKAYEGADEPTRQKMNRDALITLRVVETGGASFDLNITRYTNSQNPITERDFHSNDLVQKRLQNDFFKNTNFWYETRSGEFIKTFLGVEKIKNELLAQLYLAYFINDPFSAKQDKKSIFFSNKIKVGGLYESIFNDNTKYDDMLVAYYLHSYIIKRKNDFKKILEKIDTTKKNTAKEEKLLKFDFIQYSSFEILALFKILLYKINEKNPQSTNNKLIESFQNNSLKEIDNNYNLIIDFIYKDLEKRKRNNSKIVNSVLFKSKEYYPELKMLFDNLLNK